MSVLQKKRNTVFIKTVNITVFVIIVAVTAASILFTLFFEGAYGETLFLKTAISDFGMMFSGILLACCYVNTRNFTRQEIVFSAITVLLFFAIFLSGVQDVLSGHAEAAKAIFIIQTLISVCSVTIHILFWQYQCATLPKNRMRRYFGIAVFSILTVYILMLFINPFNKILFFADDRGNLIYPGETIETVLFSLLYLSYLFYIFPQHCSLRKKVSVACFAFFPLLFVVIILICYNFVEIYDTSSFYFLFMLLAAYVVFFGDYIESKELLLRQKATLAEDELKRTELQTALMLSQIKPHFLYNSITAIRYLCKKNPEMAYESLGLFADYLRGNIDALGSGQIIPFQKELEHIKTYLMLEQIRFGDELKVEYDIEYSGFSVPALTVQPIVENAVRHGATMNENGGKIVIRSEKTDGGALITVSDNGPGFDENTVKTDGRSHVGLKSVRDCLRAKKCGELQIESVKGKGTTVKILILGENK